MAINKSALVGGMGIATTIIQTLVAEVKRAGGKEDDIHRLATPDALDVWREVAKLIVKKEEELMESINQTFTMKVYYKPDHHYFDRGKWDNVSGAISDSHDSMLFAKWKHDEVDTGEKKEQEVTFKIFPCKLRDTVSDDIIAVMARESYRPAIRQELLAFGAEHPALQRRYKIIALGSVYQMRGRSREVPILQGSNTRREVGLCDFDKTWNYSDYLFLGVGKPVEVVNILVLGPQWPTGELQDYQECTIRNMFPGKRLNYITVNAADGRQYERICEYYKPGMVILPDKLPLFVMKQEIPHVIVSCEGFQKPIHTTELLPVKHEFRPYPPKA